MRRKARPTSSLLIGSGNNAVISARWLRNAIALFLIIGNCAMASAAGTDISGVIRDVRGRAITNARVSLMRIDSLPALKAGDKPIKSKVELDTQRTSANGAFRFSAVSNGNYELLIARGGDWLIAEGLKLDGAAWPSLAITLDGKTRVMMLKR